MITDLVFFLSPFPALPPFLPSPFALPTRSGGRALVLPWQGFFSHAQAVEVAPRPDSSSVPLPTGLGSGSVDSGSASPL